MTTHQKSEAVPARESGERWDSADSGGTTRAVDGRMPGRRARETRTRLLDQTRIMLTTTSYRDLKVVDVARGAGTSPAAFYQYFPDVEAALIALADDLIDEGRQRLTRPVLEGDWSEAGAYGTCLSIASTFLDFWADHGPLMGVIELAAAEGDPRFQEVRIRLLSQFTDSVGEVARRQQAEGSLPADLDPTATAAVLVAMLAHVSGHQYGIEAYGTSMAEISRAMARLIHAGLTGAAPPE